MRRQLPILLVVLAFALLPMLPRGGAAVEVRAHYWPNGQVREESEVLSQAGGEVERHGFCRRYWENGNLSEEGTYLRGLMEGEWKFFDEAGEFIARGEWKADRGHYQRLFPDGKVLREGPMIGLDRQGEWVEFYSNGRIRLRGNYERGEQHGIWEAFTDEDPPRSRKARFEHGEERK